MEIQASRLRARVGPVGEPILLADQDRSRWDRVLMQRGLGARCDRASRRSAGCSARTRSRRRSPPATRGRRRAGDTDWERIAALYDALAQLAPSPVVELNRAVAVGDGVRAARPGSSSSTRSSRPAR